MDKKVLKFYEAPVVEAMELEIEGFLCNSGGSNAEGVKIEPWDDDEEDDEDA